MLKNILARIFWTIVLVISLIGVLAFIWDVPNYLGYAIPPEFAKLPMTLFLLVGIIAGLAGTWSARSSQTTIVEKKIETEMPPPPEKTSEKHPS